MTRNASSTPSTHSSERDTHQMSTTAARPEPARQLLDTGVMAIVRSNRYDYVPQVAQTLAAAGVTCLEITLTVPGALDRLPELIADLPDDVCLGVGTVTSADEAEMAAAAGAAFLVCPALCTDVLETSSRLQIPCYPGAWTPTEVLTAWNAGATAVKLFPAATGGPTHLRRLREPLTHIPIIPTGGVSIEAIPDYLAAGAFAVGMGSPLLGDSLEGGSLDALAERATTALDVVRSARKQR